MRQFIKRCSNLGSDVIGFIRIGSDSLTLIEKNKEIKGILNGCEIFKIGNLKDYQENVSHVLSDLTCNIYEKNKPEEFILYKEHWANDKGYPTEEIFESIASELKKKVKVKVAVKVRAKKSNISYEPSIKIDQNIDSKILNNNIKVLNNKISNFSIVLQNALKYASIIAKHKYNGSSNKDTAWGLKDIEKYMNAVRIKLASLNSETDKIDFYKEMLDKTIGKVSLKIAFNVMKKNPEEKKIVSQVLIPSIINNYEGFKNLATKVILIISPLISVDKLFKKVTNYPVNWFISDDVLMNLKEDYDFLINFLQDIPKIEANAIMPLDIYSAQILK